MKKPIDFGRDGGLLYRAGIHTIEAIGDNPGINVTQLAFYLGVTKGAISQTIGKLIKKGMVDKAMVSPAVNEVALNLTEKGMLIYGKHQDYHAEMYRKIAELMADCPAEQLKLLANLLDVIERFLDTKS